MFLGGRLVDGRLPFLLPVTIMSRILNQLPGSTIDLRQTSPNDSKGPYG